MRPYNSLRPQPRAQSILDRQIAFHRSFVELTHSINASLLLSQAVYWTLRIDGGWFYKTREDWSYETGMSRKELETARKTLRSFSFWHEDLRGVPATLHFMVDVVDLETQVIAAIAKWSDFTLPESGKQAVTRGSSQISRIGQTPSLLGEETNQETEHVAWGDSHEDSFVRFVCSQCLRIKWAERFYPKRERVEDLVSWLKTFMPDEASVRAEFDGWVDWNNNQPAPRSRCDLVMRIRNWFTRKVSRYSAQTKKKRGAASFSFGSSLPQVSTDSAAEAERILRERDDLW